MPLQQRSPGLERLLWAIFAAGTIALALLGRVTVHAPAETTDRSVTARADKN